MKWILMFLGVVFTCISPAQKRNNVWIFGDSTGLNFNTNPVTPFYSKLNVVSLPYYVSSICDEDGDLLMYTDGLNIYNRDNFIFPKYNNWWPWVGNVIPLIVPYIDNDSLYYIFGVNDGGTTGVNNLMLQYFTTKIYKPGDIEEAVYPRPTSYNNFYTTLALNASHALAGTIHCNQKDIWITVHSPGTLMSFLVTSAGVSNTPVVTPVPDNILPSALLQTKYSNIKFSANSERLIIPDNDRNEIVVYDFDNQSGTFSNPMVFPMPNGMILEDIEISADGSKLYFGAYEFTDPDVGAEIHFIFQLGLNAGGRDEILKTLYKVNFGDRVACIRSCYVLKRTMQLGPDGKIYINRREGLNINQDKTLGVIEEPSKVGKAVSYKGTAVDLKMVPKTLNYSYIRSGSFTPKDNSIQFKKQNCADQPVDFSLIFSRVDSVKWDFGDPQAGNANFSRLRKPQHQFPTPGTYNITAVIYDRCFVDTAVAEVTITPDQKVALPEHLTDTTLCMGEELVYNVYAPNVTQYVWDNLSTSPERKITETGDYTITIYNDCSFDYKTFHVAFRECTCNSFIPNAFTPNHDGINDTFGPVFDCSPQDYVFNVYDRYGQKIFSSAKKDKAWDGKIGSEIASPGIYAYTVLYRHPSTSEIVRKKGTVVLLR